jgi:hypothetical protein
MDKPSPEDADFTIEEVTSSVQSYSREKKKEIISDIMKSMLENIDKIDISELVDIYDKVKKA